jgi:hypothetical protein
MHATTLKPMLDPARIAREEGRLAGRKEMRDQIKGMFASFASTHPDQVVADELWTFVGYIERTELS